MYECMHIYMFTREYVYVCRPRHSQLCLRRTYVNAYIFVYIEEDGPKERRMVPKRGYRHEPRYMYLCIYVNLYMSVGRDICNYV